MITLRKAIEREAQLLRDIATFCEGRAQASPSDNAAIAYGDVRDHCLRLAKTRKP